MKRFRYAKEKKRGYATLKKKTLSFKKTGTGFFRVGRTREGPEQKKAQTLSMAQRFAWKTKK